MKKILIIAFLIVIAIIAIKPIPGSFKRGESVRGVIELEQVKIISSIIENTSKNKTDDVSVNKLDLWLTNIAVKNNENNYINYIYEEAEWIMPYLFYKYIIRTIHTKYFISRGGMIIVYSYYFPKVGEKNVLVTIRNRQEAMNYEQKYVTEKEMLSILNKNGLTLKQLSITAPSWEGDVGTRMGTFPAK
jgi:hypothetical protein